MEQKLSEQLKSPDAVDLALSINLPRWGGSDSASAMESARSLEGSAGTASLAPVPVANRWRWPAAFALVAVVALALAFVAGGRQEGSRSMASVAPPAPSTIATDAHPIGSGLRSPAAAPPSSSAMTALPAPTATVAAERASQPAVPAWAHAPRARDRGAAVDLSAEPPKQRRPLDEKDPYE